MGPIWGRQDPGGPHVGPMNFANWGCIKCITASIRFVTDWMLYINIRLVEKYPETFAVFSRGQRKLDTIWLVAIWCACADNIYLVLFCLDSEWRSHDRCSTRSVPCLLMPWPLICPCHHRLWYGLFVNTFKPRQTGRHFADDISKFVPKGPINNIPTLVQIMAWPWTFCEHI